MHSHDRTLIARLGFDDPDKRNPRHDLACQYLAMPDTLDRLARAAWAANPYREDIHPPKEGVHNDDRYYFKTTDVSISPFNMDGTPTFASEIVLRSGTGWVAGFMDFGFRALWSRRYAWKRHRARTRKTVRNPEFDESKVNPTMPWCDQKGNRREIEKDIPIDELEWEIDKKESRDNTQTIGQAGFVEVKIGRVSAGEMIRQINFYRQYEPSARQHLMCGSYGQDSTWFLVVDFDLTDGELNLLRNEKINALRLGPQFDAWVAEQTGPAPPPPTWDLTV